MQSDGVPIHVFRHITDKAGLVAVVGTLRDPSNRVKQPMINALLVGFLAGSGTKT